MSQIIIYDRVYVQMDQALRGAIGKLCELFTYQNPNYTENPAIGDWCGNEPKTLRTWDIVDSATYAFPRGRLNKIRSVLAGIPGIEWVDKRVTGDRSLTPSAYGWRHHVTLWDHQRRIIEAAKRAETCLIRAETGSGKTTAGIGFAIQCDIPTLVIVWSANVFDQWIERIANECHLDISDVGNIRSTKRVLAPITVAMQQTLHSDPNFTRSIAEKFGAVIFDENQRASAKTFVEVLGKMPAKYRIGLSADERRKDGKEFLTYDIFGGIAADINRREMVIAKKVLDVQIRVVPTDFQAPWYLHAIRQRKRPDFNKLLSGMITNDERNSLITEITSLEIERGNQVVALTHRRNHVSFLVRAMNDLGIAGGELLGGKQSEDNEFSRTIAGLRSQKLFFAAGTYQAIGQATDMPTVSVGIATTPIATNEQIFGQVRGRICRMAENKKQAVLYYLWDRSAVGKKSLLNIIEWNSDVRVVYEDDWLSGEEYIKAVKISRY